MEIKKLVSIVLVSPVPDIFSPPNRVGARRRGCAVWRIFLWVAGGGSVVIYSIPDKPKIITVCDARDFAAGRKGLEGR